MNIKLNIIQKISKNELDEIVKKSYSLTEVIHKLNLTSNGGLVYELLRKRLSQDNINYQHFHHKRINNDTKIVYTNKLIENGDIFNQCEVSIRRHMKRFLINKNGNKCSICGIEKWNDLPVPLVCDHINGNSEDSKIDNFRLVCCNCDAQLPTYKSKNRGRGRKIDREYRRHLIS